MSVLIFLLVGMIAGRTLVAWQEETTSDYDALTFAFAVVLGVLLPLKAGLDHYKNYKREEARR